MTQKTPQYIVLDIGNPTEPKETRMNKLLSQIPEGKAIRLTEEDANLLNQPQNKIIAQIIDAEDAPKKRARHTEKRTKDKEEK